MDRDTVHCPSRRDPVGETGREEVMWKCQMGITKTQMGTLCLSGWIQCGGRRKEARMDERKMRAMIRALKLDVLETLLHDEPRGNEADAISAWFDILRKVAIAIVECEVEHLLPGADSRYPKGWTNINDVFYMPHSDGPPVGRFYYECEGIHGTPGKAICIILPLEEEDGKTDI